MASVAALALAVVDAETDRADGVSAGVNGNAAASGQLLTAEQLARRWSVPRSHVYRLAREGRVPSVRLGKYVRFRLAAIEAFELEGGCSE